MTDDIKRSRVTELRAKLENDRKAHEANLTATAGAIQALDLLLVEETAAAPTEPAPE